MKSQSNAVPMHHIPALIDNLIIVLYKLNMNDASNQIIIVSNRLPVTVTLGSDSQPVYSQSTGGLVGGLGHLAKEGAKWIGWPGISLDEISKDQEKQIRKDLALMNMVPVFLTKKQVEMYYNGYCNSVLWPQLHERDFFCSRKKVPIYKEEYLRVNSLFANIVIDEATPSSLIWIHDYHLLLVPSILNKAGIKSGFFLHTPFPSSMDENLLDVFESLEKVKLIGFQTDRDLLKYQEFYHTYKHSALSANVNNAIALPIGVDPALLDIALLLAGSRSAPMHNKTILTVDRLDPCKAIIDRVKAFDELLTRNKEIVDLITLCVLAVPNREHVSVYAKERADLELLIDNINAKYSLSNGRQPITYMHTSLDKSDLFDLYRAADIALICPPLDGMNLVAKEFVIACQNQPKALILSRGVGASEQLREAIIIEEYSQSCITDAIEIALNTSPDILYKNMEKMKNRTAQHTSREWAKLFIEKLKMNTATQ